MAFSITDDHVHDAKKGRRIMEFIRDRIRGIFGDKGYVQSRYLMHSDQTQLFRKRRMLPRRAVDRLQGLRLSGSYERHLKLSGSNPSSIENTGMSKYIF
jgi:hypothetical protein